MKYRKKPVVIDAVQWNGKNTKEIEDFVGADLKINPMGQEVIRTLEGDMKLTEGDYIIKGVNGEFYPCKPDIFAKTYEPVPDRLYLQRTRGDGFIKGLQFPASQAACTAHYGIFKNQ